jgi:hypothetical protein
MAWSQWIRQTNISVLIYMPSSKTSANPPKTWQEIEQLINGKSVAAAHNDAETTETLGRLAYACTRGKIYIRSIKEYNELLIGCNLYR